MTPSRYLVQVAQSGQPWLTLATCHARGQAEAFADVLANLKAESGRALHDYVRVTINDACVYDTRVKKGGA